MNKLAKFLTLAAGLAAAPGVHAQEWDVTRRTYAFLDDRLVINVIADAGGELQVVRGDNGRVEVAARSNDGFPGFGLGGDITRELRLTAVGANRVQYLVVVPEHVRVTVRLPGGSQTSLASRAPSGRYNWQAPTGVHTIGPAPDAPLLPTMPGGLYLVHATRFAPAIVDVPNLSAVRSLAVRFEGAEFRVASSRPLAISPGNSGRLDLLISGEPLDLVLYVPRAAGSFQLRSGSLRLIESVAGQPRALCGGAVIQKPTAEQDWLTLYPEGGRLACR
jgi:hypothetical protein